MNDSKQGAKDLALIKGIVEGNIGSFDLLFKNYYEGLLSFAKELLPYPNDEAEDIICDMFGSLWANRNQLQVKTSIASYLYISVRNRVYDHFKKNKVITLELQEGDLDLPFPKYGDPHQLLVYKELETRILYLISKLPKQTRLVFYLNRNEGFTYAEIAAILSISVNSVKTHMYRAIKFLKIATAIDSQEY